MLDTITSRTYESVIIMKKKSSLLFIYPILILVLTWPIFPAWIPELVRYWRWYPLGALISFFFAKEYLSSKQFKYLIGYSIIVYINCLMGDKYMYNPIDVGFNLIGLFFITSAPFIFIRERGERLRKVFFYMFILLMIYTSIASYVINLEFPDVVRNDLTDTGLEESYFYSYLYKYGLTKYQFAHAMPILIPPFVMAYKNKNSSFSKRMFSAAMVFLCILHAYVSGASTPFMLSLIVTIFAFAIKHCSVRENIRSLSIITIFFLPLFIDDVQLFFMRGLDSIIGGEGAIHEHIVDMQESVLRGSASGNVGSRLDLYSISWRAFFNSPVWGVNDVVGEHSVFLDHLAAFGLIGFIPLIMFLLSQTKWTKKVLHPNQYMFFYISVFATFFLLATKNVQLWTLCCFLFVAVPIIMLYLSKDEYSNDKY